MSIDQHLAELRRWRQNRANRNLPVDTVDRAIRVTEAYQYILRERRFQKEAKQKDMMLGAVTLIAVAAIAFTLGRK